LRYTFGSLGRFVGVLLLGGSYSSATDMPAATTGTVTATPVTGLAGSAYNYVTCSSGNWQPGATQDSAAPLVWMVDVTAIGQGVDVLLNNGYAVDSSPWCSYMIMQIPFGATA